MTASPWLKWYWADWRSDPCLRMCSLAARGLWAEMLALMQEAVPYGHLLIAGRSPSSTQLAALAGAPSEQIPDLLAELEAAGVFSRTKEGVAYSRRMVRDERKARIARKNGQKGGNPTLCNNDGNSVSDNPPDKGGLKTQKPEARYQKDNIGAPAAGSSAKSTKAKGHSLPDDWKPCEKHFTAAIKLGRDTSWVQRQAEAMRNWALANAHQPNTRKSDWDRAFLNWMDTSHERQRSSTGIAPPSRPDASTVDWPLHVSRYQNGQTWPSSLGPQPGYAGCRAPVDVLRAHGFGGELGGAA